MSIASRLTERVTIEQRITSADEFGGQEVSWEELVTVFAEVVALAQTVRERSLADQVKAVAGYRVRMRYRDDVDASMRFVWRERVLQLHSLQVQGALMECLAYEEQL